MKTCFKCELEKPLTEFYRHKMMADGHLNKCKDCAKRDAIATRAAKLDYYMAYDRARSVLPHRVAAREQYAKDHRAARALWRKPKQRRARDIAYDELQVRAKNWIGRALSRGKIAREPCFMCGAEPAEAHHSAYDLPLHVTWLCRKHHMELHRAYPRPVYYAQSEAQP
jgi:hypothetical protein